MTLGLSRTRGNGSEVFDDEASEVVDFVCTIAAQELGDSGLRLGAVNGDTDHRAPPRQ